MNLPAPLSIYSLSAALCLTGLSYAAPVTIINGTFDDGMGAWAEANGDGVFSYSYPTTGGNPGNHGIIDNSAGGGWGIWISNFEFAIRLTDLGLEAGNSYTFSQDMKINSGSTIGGFKVDFFSETAPDVFSPNGSTGDIFPTLIGDGSTWETYDFDIAVPSGTDGVKVVPLWGANSAIAYDNIQVDNAPLDQITQITDFDFEAADGLAWEQSSSATGFTFDFPATGGNPNGHGRIDNSAGGGWGVLVTNNGAIINLDAVGLQAGNAYLFQQDMKLFSGDTIGGFKVDFFNGGAAAGSTGDIFPAIIGDGSTWETYDFEISIPESASGIKVVPLWGAGSDVGFDNLVFSNIAIEVPDITEIPNADFEAGSDSWQNFGAPNTVFTFETTGGNPDGYALLTNDGEGFGVIVSNGGGLLPLEGLGLTAGDTFVFQQDMRIFSGSQIGGLKVEFYNSGAGIGDTGDLFPQLIGDGSTWETYDFQVVIPPGANSIKVVPLWGSGSSVGIDNISYNALAIPSPPILNADFEAGGANWEFFADGAVNPNSAPSFPTTGGNPGGFAQIENFDSWAVFVSNSTAIIPISKFGFTEDADNQFMMDMKLISGSSIGGLKVEFYQNGTLTGDSGDFFPSLIGDGSTWETYTFDIYIPTGNDGVKIVPLWGANSTVGYDNIVAPIAAPSGFAGWIAQFPGVGELNGFNDDPDNDGQPNGLENFLGTDPSVSSAGLALNVAGSAANQLYSITHSQNAEPLDDISSPVYEWSTDLVTYYKSEEVGPNGTLVFFEAETDTPTLGTTTVDISVGGATPPKFFVRVVVSESAQ